MRADAQRNRELVLRTAAAAFAAEGLTVSVHEIARRAGVGTGTVSRHFPTKQDLFAAVLLDRMRELTEQAQELITGGDPGLAFFDLFTRVVHEGRMHRGLADALAGASFDLDAAARESGWDVSGLLESLLHDAQEAGAVRSDVTFSHVKALMAGCLSCEGPDCDRVIDVVCRGLR
jgi:AcrR family transcriptional regulator